MFGGGYELIKLVATSGVIADTPAHRRRRRRALAVLAVLSAAVGTAVGAGGNGDRAQEVTELGFCRGPSPAGLAKAAGQGVVVRMEARATRELRRQARSGEIGGVVLFPPEGTDPASLAEEVEALQRSTQAGDNPSLLITIDQEGGTVERLPSLAPALSPSTIALSNDRGAAEMEGDATGSQLARHGVNVNLAPVLDIPSSELQFMAPRAFGYDERQVSRLGLAFAEAMQAEGVAATAKHFPGLGAALENTDLTPTAVDAPLPALRRDMEPFRRAIDAGVRLVMVGLASYPALGGGRPAALSPAVVRGELRERLGFDGVVITDDLLAPAIATSYEPRQAALAASAAGVDLLLFAARPAPGIASGLRRAVERGRLDEEALRVSCERIEALKGELATSEPLTD